MNLNSVFNSYPDLILLAVCIFLYLEQSTKLKVFRKGRMFALVGTANVGP